MLFGLLRASMNCQSRLYALAPEPTATTFTTRGFLQRSHRLSTSPDVSGLTLQSRRPHTGQLMRLKVLLTCRSWLISQLFQSPHAPDNGAFICQSIDPSLFNKST